MADFPVVVSVPHAGRHYPSSLIADAAVPMSSLRLLEDRHADLLVAGLIDQGATVFIANHARAFLDLNRDPREIDPRLIDGLPPPDLLRSSRVKNGLGLIPSHLGSASSLWRRRLSASEISKRIEDFHKPYHDAIEQTLATARRRFGAALLLECHSMPPLSSADRSVPAPDIIIGDCFGRSATPSFSDLVAHTARSEGFRPARNVPYAGGYSIDRHGAPHRRIHALQIEVDRSRYLDRDLYAPGAGVANVQGLFGSIFAALCEDLLATPSHIAAE
ncbi:MAG: N-formylglutamate amidohydrolase [Sphingomonadaceae bacterium]